MKTRILDFIDFEQVNILLEGFNKTTGFVTAILDLDGKILSKSGWRQMCTHFHRINPETSKLCTISDTVLAGKMAEGEKYHFYKCLNGLVDVAVPIVINGEHIANLFSGQFFFEEPDRIFYKKQAEKYGFDEKRCLEALENVPVVSKEKLKTAMDFLLEMTQLISEMTFQKLEQTELNSTIRESEEKFKYIFEAANVGKSITLPTGEMDANEAFCKMLGYTREELKYKRWQEITPEEEIPIIQKTLEPLFNGEKDTARFEKRYICKNGTRTWADISITIRRDENDKLLYLITTIIDINERKLAEKDLKESQFFFEQLFIQSSTSTQLLDSEGWCVKINPKLSELFGVKPEDIEGKKYNILQDGEIIRTGVINHINKVFENKETIKWEVNFDIQYASETTGVNVSKPEKRWFHNLAYPILNANGELIYVIIQHEDITERKLAEESLRENEERYRLISEVVSDYIFTSKTDKNGNLRLSWVTGAFEPITGYGFDEYIARGGWRAALHHDDIEKDIQDLEELKKNNQVITDVRTIAKDGRIVWVRVYAHPVWDHQNNELIGIYGGVKDITESKLAENALAISEARLNTLVQTIPDLIWLKDINGVYLSCNAVFERFYGAKEGDIIGKTDYDFVDRELADFFLENDRKAISLGKPSINEEWIIFADDGHSALLETTKTPMYNSSGTLLGVLGIGHDITTRKKAEEALRESELRLSSIYSTVGDIILHLAVEAKDKYRFISVNQAFSKATGLNEEMVIGKLVNEVIPEPSLSIVLRKYNQAIQEKSVIRWEETSEYPTGLLIGDVSIAPVFDDNGLCTHLVGSVHDITERKRIEVVLKESNDRLNLILENNPIAIWDWDIKTDRWFATQNYYTMLGYEPESKDPDRTIWLDRIHPDDRENVRIKISNVLNHTDNQYSYEARVLHADGSYRWHTVLGKAIDHDENGNVSHLIGVRIDTNDRKQAEEEIRNQLEELRRWYEVTLDREGRVLQLKREVNELLKQIGEPLRYASVIPDDLEVE